MCHERLNYKLLSNINSMCLSFYTYNSAFRNHSINASTTFPHAIEGTSLTKVVLRSTSNGARAFQMHYSIASCNCSVGRSYQAGIVTIAISVKRAFKSYLFVFTQNREKSMDYYTYGSTYSRNGPNVPYM